MGAVLWAAPAVQRAAHEARRTRYPSGLCKRAGW